MTEKELIKLQQRYMVHKPRCAKWEHRPGSFAPVLRKDVPCSCGLDKLQRITPYKDS